MAIDTAAQIAALTASIARQAAILDSGMTQVLENGRMVKIDLGTVRDSMNANVAALARLTGTTPQVRRIFVSTPRRGY
jgi:hypothetical protein